MELQKRIDSSIRQFQQDIEDYLEEGWLIKDAYEEVKESNESFVSEVINEIVVRHKDYGALDFPEINLKFDLIFSEGNINCLSDKSRKAWIKKLQYAINLLQKT